MGERNNHILWRDQVLVFKVFVALNNFSATAVPVLIPNRYQLIPDHFHQSVRISKDKEMTLESDPAPPGIRSGFSPVQGRSACAIEDPESPGPGWLKDDSHRCPGPQPGSVSPSAPSARSDAASMRVTTADSQACANSPARASAGLDAFLMSAMTGSIFSNATASPSSKWARARAFFRSNKRSAGHHLPSMANKVLEEFYQCKQSGLVIPQGDYVNTEHCLHLRMLVKIIKNDFRVLAFLKLNHYTHPGFVRFIAQTRDPAEFLVAYKLRNLL